MDDRDAKPADLAKALALVSLACRIAPEPRLWLHLQWAACARGARDAGAEHESAEALVRLWPDRPVALQYAEVLAKEASLLDKLGCGPAAAACRARAAAAADAAHEKR